MSLVVSFGEKMTTGDELRLPAEWNEILPSLWRGPAEQFGSALNTTKALGFTRPSKNIWLDFPTVKVF
jgi:hypothetical protein